MFPFQNTKETWGFFIKQREYFEVSQFITLICTKCKIAFKLPKNTQNLVTWLQILVLDVM